MTHLQKGLVPFWSNELIDEAHSDVFPTVNRPTRRDIVMVGDMPWEERYHGYYSIFRDGDLYRMYYQCAGQDDSKWAVRVCYAESHDGIHWVKPVLNLCEYGGNTENNIILSKIPDNSAFIKDNNPNCPPEERYKVLLSMAELDYRDGNKKNVLECRTSADGIHFKHHSIISRGYAYDTQNALHWDPHTKKYYCYFRDYHPASPTLENTLNEKSIRGVMVIESEDFVHWSEPRHLDYGNAEDYPLYTNGVVPYPLDDRYQIGLANRYNERREWTGNFDRLCTREHRLWRMEYYGGDRQGLAITDCVFMSSADHYRWHRFDEAILTPEIENNKNWVYGDCFPAFGCPVETAADYEGEPNELSLYSGINYYTDTPKLVRYTYRIDGFASLKAPYAEKTVVTKPFTFEGESLTLNFKTSARGHVYLRILDETGHAIEGYRTYEMFGDTIARPVDFEKPLSALGGKAVRFEFKMSDAEIFSMRLQ